MSSGSSASSEAKTKARTASAPSPASRVSTSTPGPESLAPLVASSSRPVMVLVSPAGECAASDFFSASAVSEVKLVCGG